MTYDAKGWFCYDKNGIYISGPWESKAQAVDWERGYGHQSERPITIKKYGESK